MPVRRHRYHCHNDEDITANVYVYCDDPWATSQIHYPEQYVYRDTYITSCSAKYCRGDIVPVDTAATLHLIVNIIDTPARHGSYFIVLSLYRFPNGTYALHAGARIVRFTSELICGGTLTLSERQEMVLDRIMCRTSLLNVVTGEDTKLCDRAEALQFYRSRASRQMKVRSVRLPYDQG